MNSHQQEITIEHLKAFRTAIEWTVREKLPLLFDDYISALIKDTNVEETKKEFFSYVHKIFLFNIYIKKFQ
jgi:hypothetical protein